MEKDKKIKFCQSCKKWTTHLRCGFGTIGGLVGNARWRCLVCKTERI